MYEDSSSLAIQNATENCVTIMTMSSEEVVLQWARENKISQGAVDRLFEEGFTSLEALRLLDEEDLSKSKIPRGQKKLILACVRGLGKNDEHQQSGVNRVAQTNSTERMRAQSPESAQTNQSAAAGTSHDVENGDSQGRQHQPDNYVQGLVNQLVRGQFQAPNGLASDLNIRHCPVSGSGSGVLNEAPPLVGDVNLAQAPVTQSWKDPQIYLSSAATGKSAPSYYDIIDFVGGGVEEEVIVGNTGSHQVVLKSGPRKPKLENVSLAQWTVANLAILYKLQGEAKLTIESIMDYLSYTTKICQLVQRYSLVSVLLYDREYRKLQCHHNFRWGTDVPHLHSVYLQPRIPRPNQPLKGTGGQALRPSTTSSPLTSDGRVICKLFNSRGGCHYKEACKFMHQCSHPGCRLQHSAVTHQQSKNF